MHWDTVEVAPKVGYSLFVRFKDGLEGIVHLRHEQLTDALKPLRDESFFRQVFVDNGAVPRPGEIDLAPDAIYAELSSVQKKTEPSLQFKFAGWDWPWFVFFYTERGYSPMNSRNSRVSTFK
jgi:hypothetical protein